MELKVIREPDLVVAIDVGSTHSGYACQWREDFIKKGNVEFNTKWGEGAPQIHKTSTLLLLKYENDTTKLPSIVAFGHTAERQYANIQSDEDYEQEKHYYKLFKKFKMRLYTLNKDNYSSSIQTESVDGFQEDISTVMFLFIKALKDDFLNKNATCATESVLTKTLWVVTVPALWTEKTRMLMRAAAEMTGIGEHNLLLASEPECAAVYYINLPQKLQIALGNIGEPGTKFLTADIGGGTGDLSAVEVQSDGTFKELCNVSGERVGGEQVNEAFYLEMYDSFKGGKVRQLFSEAEYYEIMKLEEEFENCKLTIRPDTSDEKIKIPIPNLVREKIKEKELELKNNAPITYNIKTQTLEVKRRYVREKLFEVPCSLIHNTISTVLKEHAEIKIVVLVGGFAESSIVQENLRSKLKEKFAEVKVVVPTSPFRAVLTGAVIFGHNPLIFTSRISRATYGIAVNELFDETKHNQSKKWFDEEDNVHRCKDVLSIHVKKGEAVALNEALNKKTYLPWSKSSKVIHLQVYETSDSGPVNGSVMYTTDHGCKKIAEISVDVPTAEESSKRDVSVRMIYGGTQLSVIAVCAHTGKECRAVIRFD
ncbi:heat shock 70 kDa protein 12B-like isoform X2 [Dreissena polymorpha]|uniref:heat shock 70 kDa protein 12B-like isoform X2 n=1 Tax=Dreissena polymorpha TaxID=45954 RepID=UPI00226562A3|nr:heat shock 70 kDa protein 12B-like isoform X2 [Dreissena polymorpha]